ncbi:hypothetical protein H2198_008162 [Neophaeococcomyces mojaviensis]|uniref:Uncharacterized protein n=1 Tax=Neophaeococcomyces mojaviensis TaxID=3383035 RepID=A0ACC2ZY71_9EURO|nr:hypothetical protein H2198_008162 [Knufia sp. JES_112]
MAFLLNIKAEMPAEVNDHDFQEDAILEPSNRSTHISLMNLKIRLFKLATRVTCHISGPSIADETILSSLDKEIAAEQSGWDSVLLVNGHVSVLGNSGYAHWCILQTYAHQLYLLIHRPFHHSHSARFRPASKEACLRSSMALLSLHQQLCEVPRLRCYRWLVGGMTSSNVLHGAVALASCLLDSPETNGLAQYRVAFDAAVMRVEGLQPISPVCVKAYPVMRNLQIQLREHFDGLRPEAVERGHTEEWIDQIDWFNSEYVNEFLWERVV